jgi:hypothetical protein
MLSSRVRTSQYSCRTGIEIAATYGRYRSERIRQIGEQFTACGDYLQGVARIRCTNPECGLVSGHRLFQRLERDLNVLPEIVHADNGHPMRGVTLAV